MPGAMPSFGIEADQDGLACCPCVERKLEKHSAIAISSPGDASIQPRNRSPQENALSPFPPGTTRATSTQGGHGWLETLSPASPFHSRQGNHHPEELKSGGSTIARHHQIYLLRIASASSWRMSSSASASRRSGDTSNCPARRSATSFGAQPCATNSHISRAVSLSVKALPFSR